jgi:tetratricopeptide (TPR) repeat protein
MDRALEFFGPKYVAKNITDANRLYTYASFWAGEGKNLESALTAATKVVELSPATPYYWGGLATVHQKLKHYDEAIAAGEKAFELADENQKPHYKSRLDSIKQARQAAGDQPREGK